MSFFGDSNAGPRLARGIVLFVIGCTALPLGIVFGTLTGLEFLIWIAGALFVIGLVAFIIGLTSAIRNRMGGGGAGFGNIFTTQRDGGSVRRRTAPRRRARRITTRCPSCGARVDPRHIEDAPEGPVVICPYCESAYTPEENAL
ncbi:MAG: hypothetical protein GF403_10080 [Candidatus Coatesbacteria bacterium]|nr:hypothetical protein [Candidatus Coatesbacteria bacterium]